MSQASLKIPHKNDKNKLNSLIKVLRPKVYITDSSSFKKLVQELTGNGTSVAPRPPPPPPPPSTVQRAAEKFPVVGVDEDFVVGPDNSVENSGYSSSEVCNLQPSFMVESRQVEACDETILDMTALDDFPMNQEAGVLGFQDMESWLLQIDPFSLCGNGYAQSFEEAACIYDYDLAGLIWIPIITTVRQTLTTEFNT